MRSFGIAWTKRFVQLGIVATTTNGHKWPCLPQPWNLGSQESSLQRSFDTSPSSVGSIVIVDGYAAISAAVGRKPLLNSRRHSCVHHC